MKRILFLTLQTFSATGGIEKVCRIAGKAIYEYSSEHGNSFAMYSMYDNNKQVVEFYTPADTFKGFEGNRFWFVLLSTLKGIKSRIVVLSHINLLLPGYLIKLFSPKTKIVLIAHGIEVWKPLSSSKKKMLKRMDLILTVSNFTKEKMKDLFEIPQKKLMVLNNCLDPFLPAPSNNSNRYKWRNSYGIHEDDIVLMTLSRLTAKEKNKGYDKVLFAVKKLHATYPQLKYLFVGKYDDEEKQRLHNVIHELGIEGAVIFTGFVPDNEIAEYYNMADVYIMPSEKEGFGISFIEAMYYNKPVIAGNRDGTADALLGGKLGILIDPRSQEDIINAIQKVICNIKAFTPDRELLLKNFSYPVYKQKWSTILEELAASPRSSNRMQTTAGT